MRHIDSSVAWNGSAVAGRSESLSMAKPGLRWAGQLIGIGSIALTAWCIWTLASLIYGSL